MGVKRLILGEKNTSRRLMWGICAALALIGLILLLGGGKSENKSVQNEAEAKIKTLLESVDGISGVTVAVTYENYIAASAEEAGSEIKGIGIVCVGGDDPVKVEKLLSLVSRAMGVPTNRIYITGKGK